MEAEKTKENIADKHTVSNVALLHTYGGFLHIKGSGPEWYISSMVYS